MSSFSSRGKYLLTALLIGGLLASSLFLPVARAEFITNFQLPDGKAYDVSVTAPGFEGVFLVEVDDPDNPSQMCIRPVLKVPSTGIMALGDNTLVTYNASGTLHFSWGTVGISDATVTLAIWSDVLGDGEGPLDVWFSVSRWCVSPGVFFSIFGSDFSISERYMKLNTDGDVVYRWLGFYLPVTKYVWHPDSPPEVVSTGQYVAVHWPYVSLVSAFHEYVGNVVFVSAFDMPQTIDVNKKIDISFRNASGDSYLFEMRHLLDDSCKYFLYENGVLSWSFSADCIPLGGGFGIYFPSAFSFPDSPYEGAYTFIASSTVSLPSDTEISSVPRVYVKHTSDFDQVGNASPSELYLRGSFYVTRVIVSDLSFSVLGSYSESSDIPSSVAGGSITGTTTDIGQTVTSTGTLLWDDLWNLVKGLFSWFAKLFDLFASIATALFSLATTVLSAFSTGINWLAGVFADLASAPSPWNVVLPFAFAVPVLAVLYHLTHHFLRLVVQIIAAIWL